MMRASLAVLLLFVSSAYAQDAGSQRATMVGRVEAAVAEANRDGIAASERIAALDRAIEARWTLMTALPSDSHAPIWMLDQAADELARLTLSLDDARLVVGLLGTQERASVVRAAEIAYGLARRAGEGIEARFEQQRAIIDAGGELAPGDHTLNRRMAEIELAVRRPLLMGRAAALRIAGDADDAGPQDAITQLQGLRVGSGDAEAIRDTALAIAYVHQPGGKQRAIDTLASVVSARPVPAGSRTHAEAMLLRARLERRLEDQVRAIAQAGSVPPFVDDVGRVDAALLVLAVEARARVLSEAGELEQAARALIELEDQSVLGGSRSQRARLADERLSALAQANNEWTGVAGDVVLRVARALVAQDVPSLDERAIQVLDGLLQRSDDDGAIAELEPAGELLARLLLATADRTDEAELASVRRIEAVRLIASLLRSPEADLTGLLGAGATLSLGPAGNGLEIAQRRRLLSAAIERLPTDLSADRWRLGLAASWMTPPKDWPTALKLAEAAMRGDDPATRADAIALAGAIHSSVVEGAADRAPSLDALQAALFFARSHPGATEIDQQVLAMKVASALLDRGRREDAVGVLDAVNGVPGVEAIILRARAQDVLGSSEEAFAAYLAASSLLRPESGDQYWLVWTRLLELLSQERRARVNQGQATGEMEARIRGYLLKLRAVDAGLGGPKWASRLGRVERTLDSK